MLAAIRAEVLKRLKDLDYVELYVPGFTTEKPKHAHLPVISTPPDVLADKKCVYVIIGDDKMDPGIWSWRDITGHIPSSTSSSEDTDQSSEEGLLFGTCLQFIHDMKAAASSSCSEDDEPGLIILNPAQLTYSWTKKRAMTLESWQRLPRRSIFHPSVFLHDRWNMIEGHRGPREHVGSTLNGLLDGRLRSDAQIYFIGVGSGAMLLLDYVEKHCKSLLAVDDIRWSMAVVINHIIHCSCPKPNH